MLRTEMPLPNQETRSRLFSVVIPAYNSALFIAEALDSVFSQTLKVYEVIVVNDGSPDSRELERELKPYLSRIVYIKQEHRGPGSARNRGIRRAGGEYIAFLDSDDKWLPGHLAEMARLLAHDPTLDFVYADAVCFGDTESWGRTCMEMNPSRGLVTFESLVEEKCSVIGSTVVARRQALIDTGLFDENFRHGEDFDLWLRIAHQGRRMAYSRDIHSQRRIHDNNLTADIVSTFFGQAAVLEKLLSELTLPSNITNKMRLEIQRCRALMALEKSKQGLIARQYARASEELQRANRFFRSHKLRIALFLLRSAPELLRHFYMKRQSLKPTWYSRAVVPRH
jgi:glycosyltransferase involved in cell wall biosynthesis